MKNQAIGCLCLEHVFEPDFLVRIQGTNTMVIWEIKGEENDQDLAKYEATQRWIKAVNNGANAGVWKLVVTRDPRQLVEDIDKM